MRSKKAQAAMEFLMTYGWAILIVIAVVAALYATGVFKLPSGGIGDCSPCFPAGSALAYIDHNADTLIIRSGIEMEDVIVTVGANSVTVPNPGTGTWEQGENINVDGTTGSPAAVSFASDVTVSVVYTETASGLNHTLEATLHGA